MIAVLAELRTLAVTVLAAGAYGFSIGAGKNLTYGVRSLVKFPLLLLGTAALCALGYHVWARFVGVPLRFGDVQRASLALVRTAAVLLASLSPVALFLGRTMVRPDGESLGGYPGFVLANMAFVAAAGSLALVLQARALLGRGLPLRRSLAVVGGWLVLTLLVGGQLAFWLRPFFGIASLTGAPPFVLGDEPTVTGARNFYEVVWQFVAGVEPGAVPRPR